MAIFTLLVALSVGASPCSLNGDDVRLSAMTSDREAPGKDGPVQAATVATPMADEILVNARQGEPETDPFVRVNEASFALAQDMDDRLTGPAARAYARIVPSPVRSGLRNALNNTREPVIFLSFLMEFKPGKAGDTVGRFLVNSVIGIAGLFDVAKRQPFNLPRRPNGFGDVLGYHGVGPGPYLFLPLIGPTTLRDVIGGGLDRLVLPLAVGFPFNQIGYAAGTGVVTALDRRTDLRQQLDSIRQRGNPYAARRAIFLAQRQDEIRGLHRRPTTIPLVPSGSLTPR